MAARFRIVDAINFLKKEKIDPIDIKLIITNKLKNVFE